MGNGLCSGQGQQGVSQPNSPVAQGAGPTQRRNDLSPQVPPTPQNAFAAPSAASPGHATALAGAAGLAATASAAGASVGAAAGGAPPPGTNTPQQRQTAPQGAPPATRIPLMASTPGDRKAAEDLKAEGNALFTKGKYSAAIERYTEAITLCPDWAVLYVNRGMAARKRGEWERVEADASAALALSPGERDAMKSHYLLGVAMESRMELDRATYHLRKALDAAREANDSIKDDIWRELAGANYKQWLAKSSARREQRKQMWTQLAQLLDARAERTGAAEEGTQAEVPGPGRGLPAEWVALFSAAAWQDVAVEAPSQFTCPLTMEIFRDPVAVPSGRSYERSALLEHLKKVGRFDPITRQQLSEDQLIPNVSLRAAVELYLEEHPWAWGEVK